MSRVVAFFEKGSSPRGRGKLRVVFRQAASPGLIPARAGKTDPTDRSAGEAGAHPRAGGENARMTSTGTKRNGSSPRGRGKPDVRAMIDSVSGLIPARAGKTRCWPTGCRLLGAHPRAGGENALLVAFRCERHGSSPRGRGKRVLRNRRRVARGLIPARAGKTARACAHAMDCGAHPRAGGENTF